MNRKLARKIQQMVKADQDIRKTGVISSNSKQLLKNLTITTKENTEVMKKIVKQFGWPTIRLVGKRGSNSAWLLIQHADCDLKFQKHCLRLMTKEAKKRNVLWENVAYLTDRVLINSGKPQLYGTQFYQKGIELSPCPLSIKDTDSLNAIRKKIGLEPYEDYNKKILRQKKR